MPKYYVTCYLYTHIEADDENDAYEKAKAFFRDNAPYGADTIDIEEDEEEQ